MKTYYRAQIVRRLISDIDAPDINATHYAKNLTLLDAIHILSTAWKNVKQQTIVNCYQKAGFKISTDNETQNYAEDDDLIIPTMLTQSDFDQYVNHDHDTPCYGFLTDEEIANSVQESHSEKQEENDDSDDEEEYCLPVTFSHANDCLRDLRRVLEERGNPDTDFSTSYALEKQINETFEKNRRQTKVTEFINW